MAATKLLNLIALSSLAILACSFGASPVNALSVDSQHHARSPVRGHAILAKKKRASTAKRCKPRPVSTAVSSAVGKPTTTPAPPAPKPTSSKAAAPQTTKPADNGGGSSTPNNGGGNSGSNGGAGKVGLAWAQNDDKALANFKTSKVSPYVPLCNITEWHLLNSVF